MEWYQKAADQDDDAAFYCIGDMFFNGHGVTKDYKKAFEMYKKAVDASDYPFNEAMYMLSTCYRFGYGVSKDIDKAEYWLMRAEESGNEDAYTIKKLMRK
jgi:TPR repeat protein